MKLHVHIPCDALISLLGCMLQGKSHPGSSLANTHGTLNIALLMEVGGWYHPRSPIRGERKGKASGTDAAGSNNKLMHTQQYGLILKHSFESRAGNQMTIIASYPICQLHGFKFYKTQQCGAYSGEGPGREDGK